MKPKKKKQTVQSKCSCVPRCLICNEITEDGQYTSDGELVCNVCCDWLVKERKNIDEI